MSLAGAEGTPADLMDARVRVPRHVVRRSFPSETVVLNLETGLYHGLNPTAGRMLEALDRSETVREAVKALAADYREPESRIGEDLCELCADLLERGLVEVDGRPAG